MRGLRTFSAYAATAGTAILSLATLNLAADHFPNVRGLVELRDYVTRRNG